MNQRQEPSQSEPTQPASAQQHLAERGVRSLLIVSSSEAERSRWHQRTHAVGAYQTQEAETAEQAFDLASMGGVSIALVSVRDHTSYELASALQRLGVGTVMLSATPTLEQAVAAMRAGALDLLPETLDDRTLSERLRTAIDRHEGTRQNGDRVQRLQQACRTLNAARHEVTEQVESMCDDLVQAYAQITRQVEQVRLASEFEAIVRQELHLEDLLRTVLEFVLAKLGSTNAAVYLPATNGEYSLGAYVNYDCPKETAELLMDHLADIVPVRFERFEGICKMATEESLLETLGEHGSWLSDYGALAFPCIDPAGECLAVTLLFRDRRTPFEDASISILETLSPIFASQLARIVRIHHRLGGKSLPFEAYNEADDLDTRDDSQDDWGDDYGMAA